MPSSGEDPQSAADRVRLNGWKEIASHLGKGVRTAQRWERNYALPSRRIGREGGEIVFAFKVTDLDGRASVLIGGTHNDRRGATGAVFDDGAVRGSVPALQDRYKCHTCETGGPDDSWCFREPVGPWWDRPPLR